MIRHINRTCDMCGKEFVAIRGNQRYCSAKCREKARAANIKKYQVPTKTSKKPALSIAQINELARAEGLNYGAYCAKHGLYK